MRTKINSNCNEEHEKDIITISKMMEVLEVGEIMIHKSWISKT